MTDGNKESIKELLSTFRTLFAIDVSALFLIVNLYSQDRLQFVSPLAFWVGAIFSVFSVALMVYLFLLAVPKIFREEDAIAYQTDIKIVSAASVMLFFIGYTLLALNISFRSGPVKSAVLEQPAQLK
jgi:hypothetical protein